MPGTEQIADQLGWVPYAVLAAYLLLLLVLGVVGYLRSQTGEEDYYLAGRHQGWVVTGLSIMATFFSSFALLGAPGLAYKEGVVFALFSLNVPVAGLCVYLLGARIWRIGRSKGYVTPADMVSDYYDSRVLLRLLVALAGFLYLLPYVMMQIKAGGELSAVLFSGRENAFEIGSVLLAIITTVYIMIGGMRSVAWSDVIQGVLLMFGMFAAGLTMIYALGGFGQFEEQLASLPRKSRMVPGTTGVWQIPMLLSVCLLSSSGSMVQPAQWMRYYSARNPEALKRGAVIFAVVLPACFIFGIMIVGVGGQVLYPLQMDGDLVRPGEGVGSFDRVLVVFLNDHLPRLMPTVGVFLASLIIVAIMAASMSTADSSLHAMSGLAVRDVYDAFIRPQASQSERVWVGRSVIVLITVAALALVIVDERQRARTGEQYEFMKHIAILGLVAISFSAQLLPLTFDMLFFRKGTRLGAIFGLLAGLAGAFLFGQLFQPVVEAAVGLPAGLSTSAEAPFAAWREARTLGEPLLVQFYYLVGGCKTAFPIHAAAWGLLFNLPVFALVSLGTPTVDQAKRDEYASLARGNV